MKINYNTEGNLEKYEYLILEKDHLARKQNLFYTDYYREYGELEKENMLLATEQAVMEGALRLAENASGKDDAGTRKEVTTKTVNMVTLFADNLNMICKNTKEANQASRLSSEEEAEMEEAYDKIAKLLHPDLSPVSRYYPEYGIIFSEVKEKYIKGVISKVLFAEECTETIFSKGNEFKDKVFEMNLPLIEESAELEKETEENATFIADETEKYLADPSLVEKRKEELKKAINVKKFETEAMYKELKKLLN